MSNPTLEAFQDSWIQSVATPLRFLGQGRAEAPAEDYAPALVKGILSAQGVDSIARLGAYRKQYWFRLFTLLQDDFPLAGHLIGWEEFNPLANAYLKAHPPGRNLTELASRFPTWLRGIGASPDLVEACRLDNAWNRTFYAPAAPLPTTESLARLADGTAELVLQPCVQVLKLTRDWVSLRHDLTSGRPVAEGLPAPDRRTWVLARQGSVISFDPVDPVLGKLLEAMKRGSSWQIALENIVVKAPNAAQHLQEWFALGAQRHWWSIAL